MEAIHFYMTFFFGHTPDITILLKDGRTGGMKVEAGPIYGKKKHLFPSLYQAPTIYFTFLSAFFYVSSKSSQAWPSCSPWRGNTPLLKLCVLGLACQLWARPNAQSSSETCLRKVGLGGRGDTGSSHDLWNHLIFLPTQRIQ